MPVWHDQTTEARDAGELVLLGVIQEQHPARCRLFAQWKRFDWPILHDPINLLGLHAVPMFVAIDEGGVVVDSNLRSSELADFLKRPANEFTKEIPATAQTATALDVKANDSNLAGDWIAAGDHRVLWGGNEQAGTAIDRYKRAIEIAPKSGAALFRLGVALRMRYDSPVGRPDDFQSAVDAWGRALDVDPNHYIYRRRIQQYGPRLDKPYPFYDWIQQARDEIGSRGDEPTRLLIEPVGAEIARPAKYIQQDAKILKPPDPNGRIRRDFEKLIDVAVTVVPGTIAKGEAVRVHLTLRPVRRAHWNNESEPLIIWIELPAGWQGESPLLEALQPVEPESREPRVLDFELQTPEATDVDTIKAYALYYVCEEERGQCLYRRKDIEIPIRFRE